MSFQFASCADDIKIWDTSNDIADPLSFSPHQSAVNCLRWNHNNLVLVSGGQDGFIALTHITDGRRLGTLPAKNSKPSAPVSSIEFSSGSRYLCCAEGRNAVVWDLKRKEKSQVMGQTLKYLQY